MGWKPSASASAFFLFFFFFFSHIFETYGYCLCTVQWTVTANFDLSNFFSQSVHIVYCLWTHKFHFSATFSLKMSLTVLFTHLKIILLQYFSVSVFSCIQTDLKLNIGVDAHFKAKEHMVWSHCSFTHIKPMVFNYFFIKNGSHSTIHTFKNYFATVFFSFSFQFSAVSKRSLYIL